MYRTNRNTGSWFQADHKPMIQDRKHAQSMGPGRYESPERNEAQQKQISWNLGKVPFASNDQRFKTDYKHIMKPGPGQYNPIKQKKGVAPGMQNYNELMVNTQNSNANSPRQKMNQTFQFKSQAPKVSIYKDEEKRIKQLYGEKKNLKYKIKLNDEILDRQSRSQQVKTTQGKLILGANYAEEPVVVPPNEAVRNHDLFNIGKMHIVGPQDYDPIKNTRKARETVIKQGISPEPIPGSVKKQMETYLSKIFQSTDPNAKQTQHSPDYHQPSQTQPTSLEDMQPFSVDKRDVTFKSSIRRDPLNPGKDIQRSPGPGSYNPKSPTNQIAQGSQRKKPNFGSNSLRSNLIGRDNASAPFTDPTHTKSPSPSQYQNNISMENKKNLVLQTVGSSMGVPEVQMTNSFANTVQRDHIGGSKDINPGPGSYDTQIQDKLKVLNYQLSTRYHLKPFGSGQVRFGYQQPPNEKQRNTIDFNQMISVKDRDVMRKREAFLETINAHKKSVHENNKNAVFNSDIKRFAEPKDKAYARNTNINQREFNKQKRFDQTYQSTAVSDGLGQGSIHSNSNFGLTFQKGASQQMQGASMQMNRTIQHHNFGMGSNASIKQMAAVPGNGFNSTVERFSYMKEMQKMGETPGPGSYLNDSNDNAAIANAAMPTSKQVALNTISSNFQASLKTGTSSQFASVQPKSLAGQTRMFKDSTSREDFNHYVPNNSNNTIALKNLGPGSYFKSRSPFLKRSYNASLPESRFY